MKQAVALGILAVAIFALIRLMALFLLLPGIIINTIRGRYKNSSRGVFYSALRDWQTLLISIPFAIPMIWITVNKLHEVSAKNNAREQRRAKTEAHETVSDAPTEVRRAIPVSKSPPQTSFRAPPSQTANTSTTPAEAPVAIPRAVPVSSPFYSVTGVARGDTLNVRRGPGANNAISARLPNGFKGIRIVGAPTMNGTTEWVHIEFTDGNGWVTSQYLQPE